MTEKELRQSYVNAAVSYLGCKESNGSHKKIIDLYNSHKPLARNYAVKYTTHGARLLSQLWLLKRDLLTLSRPSAAAAR